jgi:hypothetical protein
MTTDPYVIVALSTLALFFIAIVAYANLLSILDQRKRSKKQ